MPFVHKNYDFIVLSSKDKIELKILETGNNATGNILKLTSSTNIIGHKLGDTLSALLDPGIFKNLSSQAGTLIKKLQEIINSPIFNKDIRQVVSWVNKNIQGSGIFWETKVLQLLTGKKESMPKNMTDTDIKGLLLKLIKNIEKNSGDNKGVEAISIKVREALNLIEQEQIMNLNTMREDLGWLVHLPFINDEDFLSSELLVKKEKDASLHFSLFLDMSFTGKMNIDVSIIKDIAGIHIDVEKEETKGFIMESINELEQAFKDMGIKAGNIRCEIKENIIDDDNEEQGISSSVDLVI